MKRINKMNELNVVNSKVMAELVKPEITRTCYIKF